MKRFFSWLTIASFALYGLVLVPATSAAGSSSSLSIQPKKNYIIKPGATVKDTLKIGNLDTQNDLTVTLKMIDFTFTDQSGTPKLSIAQNAPQTAWSLKPFAALPDTITIPAGDSKTVEYSIKIPENMGAGSYYSAIMYQAGGANGGNVALNASGVTLVFVSVPGQVKENMELKKFGAYNSNDNGTTGSFVFIDTNEQPKMVAYTLKNKGNVFESPAGNVIIKDMFGHEVANVRTNPNQSLALLGQERLFATCIKTVQKKIELQGGISKNTSCTNPDLKPGRYTATLDVFYGQNGNQTHEITATVHFWYLPWWFIAAVSIALIAVLFAIWWLQRKIRAVVKGTTYKAGKGVSR